MVSGLFDNFKVKQMDLNATAPGSVDLAADDIRVSLPDDAVGGNTPVLATDEDIANITFFNADHLAASTLLSLATSTGVFDAADFTLPAVAAEATHGKDVMTSKQVSPTTADTLISLHDLTSSVTTDGNDVEVQWNASGILDFGE